MVFEYKLEFHLIWKIFLLTKNKCNLNFSKKLYNCKYEDIIWLAWERVYFRLKIFLFRKSILWNVIKKEESVFTEQTIENKKNLPSSARRSYWRPVLPLAHHNTAQHRWELPCLFSWDLWSKGTRKTVKSMSRIWLMRIRRLLLLAVKWIQKKKWHMLTLALIGRRSLNYEKEDIELNGHLNWRNLIPVLFLIQGEWSLTSWQKLWKWTMTICEKSYNGKLPDKQNLNKKEAEPSESSRVGWMA